MKLWSKWLSVVNQLEGAFSRKRTFFWFFTILIGFTIKFDAIGVTSLAHIVTMMKKNAIAYQPAVKEETKKRGRPAKYGKKLKFFSLFDQEQNWVKAAFPSNFWRPLGDLALFVLTRIVI